MADALITAGWLHEMGFRKQWTKDTQRPNYVLFCGDHREWLTASEDLAVELTASERGPADSRWDCWLRSDSVNSVGRRFVYVRALRTQREVIALLEALTGVPFDPTRCAHGAFRSPEPVLDTARG